MHTRVQCSSVSSLGHGPAHTTSSTDSNPWLKNCTTKQFFIRRSPASSHLPHPTGGAKSPTPNTLRPFQHSPHPPRVHLPTARDGNLSNAIALHICDAKQGSLSPPANPFDKDLQPPTACLVGGRIVRPPPGLTGATNVIDAGLGTTPAQHLLPDTYNDTSTTMTTLSDLDLSFYARNTHPQHCRTNFEDAGCLWNNNVPTSLSSFSDNTHTCVGGTLTSHCPHNPSPQLLPPDFGTGLILT